MFRGLFNLRIVFESTSRGSGLVQFAWYLGKSVCCEIGIMS